MPGHRARRRRRGPKGLRAARGARRATVPRAKADQLPGCRAPRYGQRLCRAALGQRALKTRLRRALRALETVRKVLTGTK